MSDGLPPDWPETSFARSRRAYDLARVEDPEFLQRWQQGIPPMIGAMVRVRQSAASSLSSTAC